MGRYTNTTIQRCGQIIGPLGEALDSVFDSKIVENELYRHRRRSENRDKNVRHHRAFPDFSYSENPVNAVQFKAIYRSVVYQILLQFFRKPTIYASNEPVSQYQVLWMF
jgi:hypothetical protein